MTKKNLIFTLSYVYIYICALDYVLTAVYYVCPCSGVIYVKADMWHVLSPVYMGGEARFCRKQLNVLHLYLDPIRARLLRLLHCNRLGIVPSVIHRSECRPDCFCPPGPTPSLVQYCS